MSSEPVTASWLLLGLSLVGGAFTLNAYRPIYRPSLVATVSFFAGWLTCELAAHHLLWQLVATGLLVAAGGMQGWPGLVGTAISVVSFWGLWRLDRRGHAAHDVTHAALSASLGDEDGIPASSERVRIRHIAAPFSMRHPRVVAHRDIVFSEPDGHRLRLDVYHRDDRPENAPVLVYVHGGAWVLGFKEYQALPMINRLAADGWVCISVDYRLAPRATFPEPMIDVKRGIAWAREHAAEYGGDPSFLALGGNSAGGHLASFCALTWDRRDLQPGFEEADTRVQACVSFYGVYDLLDRYGHWPNQGIRRLLEEKVMKATLEEAPERFDDLSPISQVRADAPPFMLVHGENDSLVPVEEARRFTESLTRVSRAPVTYMEIPDAQHAFDIFRSVRGHYALRGVAMFLRAVHRRHVGGRSTIVAPTDRPPAAATDSDLNAAGAAGAPS